MDAWWPGEQTYKKHVKESGQAENSVAPERRNARTYVVSAPRLIA